MFSCEQGLSVCGKTTSMDGCKADSLVFKRHFMVFMIVLLLLINPLLFKPFIMQIGLDIQMIADPLATTRTPMSWPPLVHVLHIAPHLVYVLHNVSHVATAMWRLPFSFKGFPSPINVFGYHSSTAVPLQHCCYPSTI